MRNFIAIIVFVLGIFTTVKLYCLPKEIFPYSLPGYYRVYDKQIDGRADSSISTGDYEFSQGGYSDILFRGIISSVIIGFILYRSGRTLAFAQSSNEHIFIDFWNFSAGGLVLYNSGWILKGCHFAEPLSIILFVLSVAALLISFLIVPHDLTILQS